LQRESFSFISISLILKSIWRVRKPAYEKGIALLISIKQTRTGFLNINQRPLATFSMMAQKHEATLRDTELRSYITLAIFFKTNGQLKIRF